MNYCNWHPYFDKLLPSHQSKESAPSSPIIMKAFILTVGIVLALACQMAASFKIEMIIKPHLENISGEQTGICATVVYLLKLKITIT